MMRSSFQRPALRISSISAWSRCAMAYMSSPGADGLAPGARSTRKVAAPHIRKEVFVERAVQIVGGRESPAAPGPPVVDVLGSPIHDGLPPTIRHQPDPSDWKSL